MMVVTRRADGAGPALKCSIFRGVAISMFRDSNRFSTLTRGGCLPHGPFQAVSDRARLDHDSTPVTVHGILDCYCVRPVLFRIFCMHESTSGIERPPRQMAGPGRCDVDTPTSRARKATRTVALPSGILVPIRGG